MAPKKLCHCKVCGHQYWVMASVNRTSYCSPECKRIGVNAWLREYRHKKGYQKPLKVVECPYCKQEFKQKTSRHAVCPSTLCQRQLATDQNRRWRNHNSKAPIPESYVATKCLKCDRQFHSWDKIKNRICPSCNMINSGSGTNKCPGVYGDVWDVSFGRNTNH